MGNNHPVININVERKISEFINRLEILMSMQKYDKKIINKRCRIYAKRFKEKYWKYMSLYNDDSAIILMIYEIEELIISINERINKLKEEKWKSK